MPQRTCAFCTALSALAFLARSLISLRVPRMGVDAGHGEAGQQRGAAGDRAVGHAPESDCG